MGFYNHNGGQAGYNLKPDIARVGQFGTSELRNIKSAACAEDLGIEFGKPVRVTAGTAADASLWGVAMNVNAANTLDGIAILTHKQATTPNAKYEKTETVPIMTKGTIWVEVPAATTAVIGQMATTTAAGVFGSAVTGGITGTKWRSKAVQISNGRYDATAKTWRPIYIAMLELNLPV